MLWASMTSLQLTTDPTMSIQIMQDCIEQFGNDIVQTLTSELLIADEKISTTTGKLRKIGKVASKSMYNYIYCCK